MNLSKKYTTFCKPEMGKLLATIRLDKVYHRAEGDYLFYNDANGTEIKVLDILGGYGACLFGHNHPELVKTAISNLNNKMPFNTQASCRGQASLLCEKLNGMMFERTDKNFVITLANTGTEAVEAAIKHAELYNQNKMKNLVEDVKRQITCIIKKLPTKNYTVSHDFFDTLNIKMGEMSEKDLCKSLWYVNNYNSSAFECGSSFIAIKGSFHGKTTGSVNLTYNSLYREPFKRMGVNTHFVKPGDIDSIRSIIEQSCIKYYALKIDSNSEIHLEEKKHVTISGFFIEPLQGEGGIHILPRKFIQECRKITSEFGIPLIFDEIQCGMGRTGTFLFSEQLGVTADYYILSKSLGGGISKISALMVDSKMYRHDFSTIHSSTFAEDDHSASIAIRTLEILEKNDNEIYKSCNVRGNQLLNGLNSIKEKYPMVIKEIRGKGLMIGIEFHRQEDTSSGVFNMIATQNLLGYIASGYLLHEHRIRVAPTLSSNTTIRLEPSAYISEDDCNTVINAIDRLCEIIFKRNIYSLIKFVVGAESYNHYPEIKNYRTNKRVDNFLKETHHHEKKVAFLGHFIEPEHITLWDNAFSEFSKEQMEMFIENLYELIDPILSDECVVTSTTGEKVHLVFIGVFVTSKIISRQMYNRDLTVILDKIDKAIELAKQKNCKVVGFGGFTSIITNNCKRIVTDSIALTSGNSLTVAMGLKAMQKAARKVGIDMEAACFAAIGAAGNIASIYSEILANSVQRVILIGNIGKEERSKIVAERIYQNVLEEILEFNAGKSESGKADLKGIAKAIYNTKTIQDVLGQNNENEITGKDIFKNINEELGTKAPIIVTSDYGYLKEADLILGASNTSEPVIYPGMLGEQKVVICDIAVPADADESVVENCENVMLIKGGLVKLPHNPEFIIRGIPLEKGEAFACMSETLLMGLSGINEDYSIGSIQKNQVNKIMEIAKIHGFELGKLKTDASF